jgi:serine phosphatase RsbU (regulator of sigma subunit)
MTHLAYKDMLAYREAFTPQEYFKILIKDAQLQSKNGNIDKAMQVYFQAARIADSLNNDTLLAVVYKNIGTEYKNQQNGQLALKYLQQSLRFANNLNDSSQIMNLHMTIGNAYKLLKDDGLIYLDSAYDSYCKSLELAIQLKDSRGMAGNYNNIGNVYKHQDRYEEALDQFFMAIEINKSSQNDTWLSYNYHNIGSLYKLMHNTEASILYYLKSLQLKSDLEDASGMQDCYEELSLLYAEKGNYKLAYEYSLWARELKIKLDKEEKILISQELEARYQNEKKENEIIKLKTDQNLHNLIIYEKQKDLDHQAELRNREKYLIYSLVLILLFLVIAFLIFWRSTEQRKRYAETLTLKNQEIEEASLEVERSRSNLELKNREITDSINYAKRIQAAILPSEKTLEQHLKSNFVIYHPKDIVAGDFYWTECIGDTVLFAVADCTGHGVPGAMVSVICHNALNTVIKQMKITDPGQILDQTTSIVLEQFEKSEDEVRDGMDIAICAFDLKTRKLTYSGANMPLWTVRDGEPTKYAATKQPVGNYHTLKPFETLEIPTQKGDMIYLSSDGYVDQFGGAKGKKFLNTRFKKLLTAIATLPLNQQAHELNTAFFDWKRHHEQVDDVCILGLLIDL